MKKLLLSVAAMFCMAALWSQTHQPGAVTSGKITYEEKVRLNIKIDGDAPQIDLPKERKSEKLLTFTSEATLFEDGKNDLEEQMESQHEDGNVRIRMVVSGENKIYTDLKNNTVTDQRDFMNRIFLVDKPIDELGWKVTGQKKNILGYTCFEAIRQDTSGKRTIAWFTPEIKVSGGPAGLGSLPGIILSADLNSGSRIYTATKIEPAASGEIKIQKPKEGKKVSEPEYKAIVAEKMKEMGMEDGGGNQVRVVIRHQ